MTLTQLLFQSPFGSGMAWRGAARQPGDPTYCFVLSTLPPSSMYAYPTNIAIGPTLQPCLRLSLLHHERVQDSAHCSHSVVLLPICVLHPTKALPVSAPSLLCPVRLNPLPATILLQKLIRPLVIPVVSSVRTIPVSTRYTRQPPKRIALEIKRCLRTSRLRDDGEFQSDNLKRIVLGTPKHFFFFFLLHWFAI